MKAMKVRRVPYVLDLMMWEWSLEARGATHPQLTTGATTMLYALDWMIDRIREEGIENRQERFRAAGQRLKQGFRELGFTLGADPRHASPVVTEFIVPEGMTAAQLRNYYVSEHNIMVGGGGRTNQKREGISFRVAHFGRAAEPERIERLIEITREFVARRNSG
jgi:aspartate aminotransferase-like enzyme